MKTVKRIIAVFLLIVVGFTVGYLFYTGSRLNSINDTGAVKNIVEWDYGKI